MIELGGILLNDSLHWKNRYAESNIVQQQRRFLSGNLHVVHAKLSKGVPISLEAVQDQGWFSLAQMESLIAIADVLGATYNFKYGTFASTIQFDHSNGSAYEFSPLLDQQYYQSTAYFTGTLNLLTV